MCGPVLKAIRALGGSARPQEVYERVSENLGLDEETRSITTPSGVPRHENQMAWARFYLAQVGLLDSSKRGVWTLTEKGRAVDDLTAAQAFDIFRTVRERLAEESARDEIASGERGVDEPPAPEDAAATASGPDHRVRVIELLLKLSPPGFERFCQRLLREAGFQNVVVTGRSRDGGIDGIGILQVNPLVSFKVLFQCKRYRETVSPSQVRDFRGAMAGRADKGIILTTGGFTTEAKREAVRDGVPAIELVDGEKLVNMLEGLELGLSSVRAFRVEESFFDSFDNALGKARGSRKKE
jgi:restriction system protein